MKTTIRVLENLQQPVLCSATQRQLGILHDSYPQARINQLSSPTSPYPSDAQKEANLTSLMAEFPKIFTAFAQSWMAHPSVLFYVTMPSR
jgi:hypothetical protein